MTNSSLPLPHKPNELHAWAPSGPSGFHYLAGCSQVSVPAPGLIVHPPRRVASPGPHCHVSAPSRGLGHRRSPQLQAALHQQEVAEVMPSRRRNPSISTLPISYFLLPCPFPPPPRLIGTAPFPSVANKPYKVDYSIVMLVESLAQNLPRLSLLLLPLT